MSLREMAARKVRTASYFCLAVPALLAAAPLAAQEGVPIDHARAAEYFEDARMLEASNPWPGRLYGPVIFVDRATRYAVADRADAEGHLREEDGVWVGTLPETVGIANTALEWAGERWTMVMWPLPAGRFARERLVAHELFHRLSPEIGLPMSSPTNAHLETAQGRLWMRLELRALVRALAHEGEERRRAVGDALAFRLRRYAELPGAEEEERSLELNEGLAEYTGVRVALPAPARAGWAAARTEDREAQARNQNITRSFAYASGPGLGLLLDDARPGWHAAVDTSTDLAALLVEAYGIDTTGLAAGADARAGAYDGHVVRAFEEERAKRRAEEQAAFRETFVEGPILRLPTGEGFQYGFNPNGVSVLEGVGQVLAGAEIQSDWGRMEVTGGVLIERDGRVTGVVVPAPPDPSDPTTGPGWTLELSDGWEIVEGARPGDWVVRPREGGGSR